MSVKFKVLKQTNDQLHFSDQSLDRKATFFTGGSLTERETVSVSMLQVHLVCPLLESELISENKGEQVNFLRALVMSLVL